jgi:hypothetical protein
MIVQSRFNEFLIRHDYKRACYRAMLSEFEPTEIAEYFDKVPLVIEGRTIKGPELYQLLWSDKGKITTLWCSSTDNLLERFLLDKGRDPEKFMTKLLWLNNQSTHIPGRVLLTWFYPKLESLFDSIDTRDMVFSLFTLFTETWVPGTKQRRVKRWEEGEWIKSIQVFFQDCNFSDRLIWDYEYIAGPQILNAPVMFGLPRFEGFGMIADSRDAGSLLWEADADPRLEHGIFRIRGEAWGREGSFHAFCTQREIDLSKFDPPDTPVVVMDRDYHCPIRKRIVLHAGAAYGAPLYLNWISHRKLAIQPEGGIFETLIRDIEREEDMQKDALEARHQAMLRFAAGKAAFVYRAADESIDLNGRHFTKGIPAKILKYLLETHRKEGKAEFEYRELKRRFDISLGQKNANFEVRLARLTEKLRAECPTVSLEKTGRGKFALAVNGLLEYLEA